MGKKPQRLPNRFVRSDVRALVLQWRIACGQRLAKRRDLVGLHRRELADLAGTSEPTVIRIEAGTLNPRDELRIALACVLRTEVADIWSYPSCSEVYDAAQELTR